MTILGIPIWVLLIVLGVFALLWLWTRFLTWTSKNKR